MRPWGLRAEPEGRRWSGQERPGPRCPAPACPGGEVGGEVRQPGPVPGRPAAGLRSRERGVLCGSGFLWHRVRPCLTPAAVLQITWLTWSRSSTSEEPPEARRSIPCSQPLCPPGEVPARQRPAHSTWPVGPPSPAERVTPADAHAAVPKPRAAYGPAVPLGGGPLGAAVFPRPLPRLLRTFSTDVCPLSLQTAQRHQNPEVAQSHPRARAGSGL